MQAACRLGRPDRLGPGTSECHCHRHRRSRNGAAPPGQPAHRPTRPAGRCRRPGRGPGGGPPSLPGPDHTCPGSGVPAAAVLADPDPGQGPPGTGAHLASYAGLAPVTRRSGSSIRGEHVSHGGNKRLKRAMFLSAFASLRSDPVSRAYYQRKRDQGKRHNQAVLALAHRRILTLHAMIRNGALYDPQPATKLPTAA